MKPFAAVVLMALPLFSADAPPPQIPDTAIRTLSASRNSLESANRTAIEISERLRQAMSERDKRAASWQAAVASVRKSQGVPENCTPDDNWQWVDEKTGAPCKVEKK